MENNEEWLGHGVAVGPSGEGKTTLVKSLANAYMQTRPVIAFDPYENGYPGHFVTQNFDEFIRAAKENRGCALIIDEAEGLREDPGFRWCFTGARNWGSHESLFLAQYHSQVTPIVRANCNRLMMFSTSKTAAREWADIFNCDEIITLSKQLGRYEFIEAYRTFIPDGRQKAQISTLKM